MAALDKAITVTSDCAYRRTFHSDQGWAYQRGNYVERLKDERIFQSMSRKGTCLDNSVMETVAANKLLLPLRSNFMGSHQTLTSIN